VVAAGAGAGVDVAAGAAEGFPFAEQELRDWFRRRYGHEASGLEIGALMEAMVARDDNEAQSERGSELWGWRVDPAVKPPGPY
jgi:hypothetical protein